MKFRHRQFLKLYLGQTPIAGNATQCYKAVFGKDMAERSAQVGGARLLALPHIKEAITKANEIALADLAIDAGFVLRENLRLYARAMGDDSYDHIKVDIDPDTGAERVHVTHKDIQAFTQTIEHNHTHQLEQRLAARSKVIEGRAQVLTAAGVDAVAMHDDDDAKHASPMGEEHAGHGAGGAGAKRVHRAEVNDRGARTQEETSSERAGATGD
jgi:phage terminase small subunit